MLVFTYLITSYIYVRKIDGENDDAHVVLSERFLSSYLTYPILFVTQKFPHVCQDLFLVLKPVSGTRSGLSQWSHMSGRAFEHNKG